MKFRILLLCCVVLVRAELHTEEHVLRVGGEDGAVLQQTSSETVKQSASEESTVVLGEEAPLHIFSEEDLSSMKENVKDYNFEADVYKVMNILTHSLYSNREIFVRELISNAVDALDRVRYLNLIEGHNPGDLEVRVRADLEAQTLTITDTGVGMNASDLIANLGTVARSGTTRFLDAATGSEEVAKESVQLIGQFGVGFYACFLVADTVTVVSKHDNYDQHVWTSKADGAFTVVKDPRGNTLPRGTSIILNIKDDATEFLAESTLKATIKRYSEFMTHPIYLYTKHQEDEQIPIEAEPKDDEAEKSDEADEDDDDDELDVSDDDEGDEETPAFKTLHKVIYEWEHLNQQEPIWVRSRNDVSEEDYTNFYHALVSNEHEDPISHIHFSAEGEIEFKSILYIPESAPQGLYEDYYSKKSEIRVYVRRVLINDKFEDFVPHYLNFVKGLVDSNDLPLNVNREQLQKSKIMKVISKKLTRKALEMIRKMAERSEPVSEEDEEDLDDEESDLADGEVSEDKEETEEEIKEKTRYFTFWESFGKSIKMGLLEEETRNRNVLKKLLRFSSSRDEEHPISLDTYISRMADEQKGIFYISGESVESVQNSPALEKVKKAGYEVLYFVDPLDEYIINHIREFENVKLISVTTENFDPTERTEAERKHWEDVQEEYAGLTSWFKDLLKDRVTKVEISKRLDHSPCILVSTQYGPSVNMERIQRMQPLSQKSEMHVSKKVLELNYRHPVIQEMKSRVEDAGEDAPAELLNYAEMLYDSALLSGGYFHDDVGGFVTRINSLIRSGLDVSSDAEVDEEVEFPPELDEEIEEEEEEEEADIIDDSSADPTEDDEAKSHSEL